MDVLIKDPMILQKHVMYNDVGLLSTARSESDAYEAGHAYKINSVYKKVFLLPQTQTEIGIDVKLNGFVRKFTVVMDAETVEDSTIIGITPHGGVELSFFTPIAFEQLSYMGPSK